MRRTYCVVACRRADDRVEGSRPTTDAKLLAEFQIWICPSPSQRFAVRVLPALRGEQHCSETPQSSSPKPTRHRRVGVSIGEVAVGAVQPTVGGASPAASLLQHRTPLSINLASRSRPSVFAARLRHLLYARTGADRVGERRGFGGFRPAIIADVRRRAKWERQDESGEFPALSSPDKTPGTGTRLPVFHSP